MSEPQPTGCLPLAALMSSLIGFLLFVPVQVDTVDRPDSPGITTVESMVTSNADWTPVIQDFGGVEMVLVPAGCYLMGSEDGAPKEQPVHQQCFDAPFWIDRYEVTWAMYNECIAAGGCTLNNDCSPNPWSEGDNQPINCETWFEAVDYCTWRESRLPTEAEWEYAARGPDNLIFPWGNDYVAGYAVYEEPHTAEVGSHPVGASWVGAEDMSGNVWEWVSTISMPYPYDTNDGRENGQDTHSMRVLRGSSFEVYSDLPRAALRDAFSPDHPYYNIGFRCARADE